MQRQPKESDKQELSDSGKDKLPFNRKKPPAPQGSGMGSHLLRAALSKVRKPGQKTLCGRETRDQ